TMCGTVDQIFSARKHRRVLADPHLRHRCVIDFVPGNRHVDRKTDDRNDDECTHNSQQPKHPPDHLYSVVFVVSRCGANKTIVSDPTSSNLRMSGEIRSVPSYVIA